MAYVLFPRPGKSRSHNLTERKLHNATKEWHWLEGKDLKPVTINFWNITDYLGKSEDKKLPALKCLQPDWVFTTYLPGWVVLSPGSTVSVGLWWQRVINTKEPGIQEIAKHIQISEVNRGRKEELTHNLIQYRWLAFCTALQVLNVTG